MEGHGGAVGMMVVVRSTLGRNARDLVGVGGGGGRGGGGETGGVFSGGTWRGLTHVRMCAG